jgi:undecaprenyl-diphosphatase
MSFDSVFDALFLGLIEGLTEFIPVSSTAHLLLIGERLGFEGPPGKVFEVVIQLGAILAICTVYFHKLWQVLIGLPSSPKARRFATAIILGFLPAAVIGAGLHGFIKRVLFHSPIAICVALIAGGVVILLVDRFVPTPRHREVDRVPPLLALVIGGFQCLAMIPGVSRSGATIIGGMLLGVERRTAAEFSFFVAIPTMLGATAYDSYKNWGSFTSDGSALIAIGFVAAFLSATVVVRAVLNFIERYGFAPFGWYRILFGGAMLALTLTA